MDGFPAKPRGRVLPRSARRCPPAGAGGPLPPALRVCAPSLCTMSICCWVRGPPRPGRVTPRSQSQLRGPFPRAATGPRRPCPWGRVQPRGRRVCAALRGLSPGLCPAWTRRVWHQSQTETDGRPPNPWAVCRALRRGEKRPAGGRGWERRPGGQCTRLCSGQQVARGFGAAHARCGNEQGVTRTLPGAHTPARGALALVREH